MLLTGEQFVPWVGIETIAAAMLASSHLTDNQETKIMLITSHVTTSGYAIIIAGLVLVFVSALGPSITAVIS